MNLVLLIKVVPTRADAVLEKVLKIDGVRKAYFSYGRFDIVVFAEAPDYKSIRAVSGRINSIDGVRSSETLPEA